MIAALHAPHLSPERGRKDASAARTMPRPTLCAMTAIPQRWTVDERLRPTLTLHSTSSPRHLTPQAWGMGGAGVAAVPAYRTDSLRLHARAQRAATTPAKAALWAALRNQRFLGLSVRRKAPIGPWLADVLIPSRRLAIRVQPETAQPGTDHPRPGAPERLGSTVLRPAPTDLLPPHLSAFLCHLAARVTP